MKRWHRRINGGASSLLSAVGLMLAACNDPGEPSTDGTLIVTTSTTGMDQDGDGYSLTLDGTDHGAISANDRVSIRLNPGSHSIALVGLAANCSVENSPRAVSLTAGAPVRDTVEITFVVTCARVPGNVRLTASTSGKVSPGTGYRVMHETFGYWDYGGPVSELGTLEPNGYLVAQVATGQHWSNYWHRFRLADVPASCSVSDPHRSADPGLTLEHGKLLDVEFVVTCPS
jgi:hypothetical protein